MCVCKIYIVASKTGYTILKNTLKSHNSCNCRFRVKNFKIKQTSLTRWLFNNLNTDLFKNLKELMNSALEIAGLDNSDTDYVVFGGTGICVQFPRFKGFCQVFLNMNPLKVLNTTRPLSTVFL